MCITLHKDVNTLVYCVKTLKYQIKSALKPRKQQMSKLFFLNAASIKKIASAKYTGIKIKFSYKCS